MYIYAVWSDGNEDIMSANYFALLESAYDALKDEEWETYTEDLDAPFPAYGDLKRALEQYGIVAVGYSYVCRIFVKSV